MSDYPRVKRGLDGDVFCEHCDVHWSQNCPVHGRRPYSTARGLYQVLPAAPPAPRPTIRELQDRLKLSYPRRDQQ